MEAIRMIRYWQNVRHPCYQLPLIMLINLPSFRIDGFFLDENEADSIYLDDIVFRDITTAGQQEELWLNQYYGYVI